MERKVRKTFSKLRRLILNQPQTVKAGSKTASDSRAVRVNLPAELGGGFTMVVCALSAQPTIRSFTAQSIAMCQATNTALLEAADWGLSVPQDEDEAEDAAPRVFLHPDTAISTVIADMGEMPELDLLRLRAARTRMSPRQMQKKRQAAAGDDDDDDGSRDSSALNQSGGSGKSQKGHIRVLSTSRPSSSTAPMQRVSSDDQQEADQWTRLFSVHCGRQGADGRGAELRWSRDPASLRSPFEPPPAPLPSHKTQLRFSLLQQLRQVKPPPGPIPPPLVCLLPPPPLAPLLLSPPSAPHLSVPSGSQRDLSASAAGGGGGTPKPKSKEERRREEERRRLREKEQAAIDSVLQSLAARDIGQVRVVKAAGSKKRGAEEEEEEDSKEEEEERLRRRRFEWCGGEKEIPLFFCPLPPPPPPPNAAKQKKQRAEASDSCFVLTSLRALQLEDGKVTMEARIGPGSGGVISVPKRQPIVPAGEGGSVRMRLRVQELENGGSNVAETAGDSGSDDEQRGDDEEEEAVDQNGEGEADGDSGRGGRRRRPVFLYATFLLPSAAVASYVQQYVLYMQSSVTLTQTLSLLSSPQSGSHTATPYRHALLGWTMLLKSFIGPLVFGPLRLPLYTHQIKQLLARVQQMQLKNVQVTSLKLLQFHLPRPELDADGEELDEDFIPSLSLRSFRGHPHHEYTFDVSWSCKAFLVRVEIQGRKVVSFKLELEMRGIEVAGCVLLRSTPYAPEQLAISFASLPSLSFGVGSHVIVGSVRLPFQQSIERLISAQIQQVLQEQISTRALYPRWIPVYFAKSAVSLLLDRWWSVAKFPFQFDGKDDDEMMGLALVVTTQAEQLVGETLREMRLRRERMEQFMTRPLYGEEAGDAWQAKEKQRQSDKEKERERQDMDELASKRKGKKGKDKQNGQQDSRRRAEQDVEDEKTATPPTALNKSAKKKKG